MTSPVAAAAPATGGAPRHHPTPAASLTFHELLSALNPLQYVPVIGTIYRAVTGDTIPEPILRFGSLVVSALMGGPIGVAINLATMAAEEVTGVDLDRAGQALLHGASIQTAIAGQPSTPVAHVGPDPTQPAHSAAPKRVARQTEAPAAQAAPQPWSPAQLAAYGVTVDRHGTLRLGDSRGADVLNTLEIARIHAAYAQVAARAPDTQGHGI